ncbi:unnamed protein product [Urochloa humidicola]
MLLLEGPQQSHCLGLLEDGRWSWSIITYPSYRERRELKKHVFVPWRSLCGREEWSCLYTNIPYGLWIQNLLECSVHGLDFGPTCLDQQAISAFFCLR